MNDSEPILELAMLVTLCLGGACLATARWLEYRRATMLIAFAIALLPAFAPMVGLPSLAAMPLAALGAIYLSCVIVARSPSLQQILMSRHGQAALLLAAPFGTCVWVVASEPNESDLVMALAELTQLMDSRNVRPPEELCAYSASTDLGNPIRLFTHRPEDFSVEDVIAKEKSVGVNYALAAVQTAPADYRANCHGWVFADGQFWLSGEDVLTILNDNGYRAVANPQPGDVVSYRDANDVPAHSGVVRFVHGDLVLVESKWSHLGCFLHPVDRQPYHGHVLYFRTPRESHVVSGIESGSSSTAAP